jgi:alpha/beta hydrolase family protein DUF900
LDRLSNDTVLLVHGTWAAPTPGLAQWYQPGDAECFPQRLNTALARQGSSARCWAHCSGKLPLFSWSGDNSWLARSAAAARLRNHLRILQDQGWQCHIVAHSHGGNVVAEALSQLTAREAAGLGNIVFAGTPFIDAVSPLRRRRLISMWLLMSPILVVFILLQLLGGIGILSVLGKGSLDRGDLFLIGIIIPTTITGLATIYRLWRHRMAVRDTVPIISSKTLVCSTPVDEAISLLRHAETASNPLDPGPSLFGYLRDVRRRYLQRQLDIERQHGLPLLWSSPILWRAVALTFYIWLTFTVLLIYVYWGYSVRARNLPRHNLRRAGVDFPSNRPAGAIVFYHHVGHIPNDRCPRAGCRSGDLLRRVLHCSACCAS